MLFPSGIPAEHVLILNLVSVGFNPTEELIQAYYGILFRFSLMALPDKIPHFLTEITVRFEYRYAIS